MANELQRSPGIAKYLTIPEVKENISSIVGEKESNKFISSIVSAVQTNPTLAQCTNQSILSAALLGHSLNLPQSPQLGYFYFVPYDTTRKVKDENGRTIEKKAKEAVFQIGYRGLIQLSLRSGQYKKINATLIKEGEIVSINPITEEYVFQPIDDYKKRLEAKTIGYYAFIELTNGFRKEIFWDVDRMEEHASKYSASYRSDKKYNSRKSFWSTSFDEMAYKTLLRQLISKYGIMSVEMQSACQADMAVIDESGNPVYVDNVPDKGNDIYAEDVAEENNEPDSQQLLQQQG